MRQLQCLLLALGLLMAAPLAAEIPIIAYQGVPAKFATAERFREFREAGFDVSYHNYNALTISQVVQALDQAQQAGVRLIIHCDKVYANPRSAFPRLKGHPALFAYFLEDEPRPKHYNEVVGHLQTIRRFDKQTNIYLNLLPDYGPKSRSSLGITSYPDYLRQFAALDIPQISFDHYPVTKDGLREQWYSNLEAVRQESLRTGKPMWGFVLSTPHNVYPQPTLATLRLQCYVNLAYGAQAIQYFTYWTPEGKEYYNGAIDRDGKRTATYHVVKLMNAELRPLLPLFDGAEVTNVGHLQKIPMGTKRLKKLPSGIKKLKVTGSEGALISTLKKDGHQYMVVVNKDYQHPMTLTLRTASQVVQITKSLQQSPAKEAYTLPAGDILIFRLK